MEGPVVRRPTAPMPPALRRVLLLGPPLALAALEVIHPRPDVNPQAVLEGATWFMVFHLIQLVLVGLVAVSVLLLADSLGRAAAWTTRVGVGVFLVFFTAYDSFAGIATGYAMRTARELTPAGQEAVFDVVKDWPGLDPVVFPLTIIAILGWLVALLPLAVVARRSGAPRLQWALIALAGIFLLGGHPAPFGTLAFGCLFLAVLLREWRSRPATAQEDRGAVAPPRSSRA
jgi:hypothetical protein